MKFKLAVKDAVDCRVQGEVMDGDKPVRLDFYVTGRRMTADEYRAAVGAESEVTVAGFLRQNLTGWRGQRLVLDDADQPADFGPEALDLMLSVLGLEAVIFAAYRDTLAASDKPKGRAGN